MSFIVSASAQPAPFFVAHVAGYVIVLVVFHGAKLALRTVLDSVSFDNEASRITMSLSITVQANISLAPGADQALPLISTATVKIWAQSQIGALREIDVLPKLEPQFLDLPSSTLVNVFTGVAIAFRAVSLHTQYFLHLSVFELCFQVWL